MIISRTTETALHRQRLGYATPRLPARDLPRLSDNAEETTLNCGYFLIFSPPTHILRGTRRRGFSSEALRKGTGRARDSAC